MTAAVAWAAALPLAAWSAARPAVWPLPALVFGVYAIGGLICHQRPERSFYLWSVQMPVCARCTGIYVGGAVAAIAWMVSRRTPLRLTPAITSGKAVLLLSALPAVATLVFEWTAGQMPSNWIRALAGFPIGAAVVWLIATEVN